MRTGHALVAALTGLALAGFALVGTATPALATSEPAEPFALVLWCESGTMTLPHLVARHGSAPGRDACAATPEIDRTWLRADAGVIAILPSDSSSGLAVRPLPLRGAVIWPRLDPED